MMAIASILGNQFSIENADAETRILGENDITISLDVYILLVPYITFVPLYFLLLKVFKKSDK